MSTEQIGFTGPEAKARRDSEWSRLKRLGYKGVTRFTTQDGGRMVYVVAYPRQPAQDILRDAEEVLEEMDGPVEST